MEIDWTPEDEAAMREGMAIKKSLRNKQPRRPRGVSKEDIQRNKEAGFLEKLCHSKT